MTENVDELLIRAILDARRKNQKPEPWNPNVYQAQCCKGLMFSARPGAFTSCKCGGSFVDQTRSYERLGGDKRPVFLGERDELLKSEG